MLGVVRAPSAFGITTGSMAPAALRPSTSATHEFVVPRSIPITLCMILDVPSLQRAARSRRALIAQMSFVAHLAPTPNALPHRQHSSVLGFCRWGGRRLGNDHERRANQAFAVAV